MSILGSVGGLIPEVISGVASIVELFDGGTQGPTRADWAMLEYQRQMTAAMTPVVTPGMLPGLPYTPQPAPIPVAAAMPSPYVAAPIVAAAAVPAGRALPGLVGPENGLWVEMGRKTRDLKDLISAEWQGWTAQALREAAREKKFSYADFTKASKDPGIMSRIWQAMGGIWASPTHADNQFRQHVLQRLDEALAGLKKKRRSRGPSLKTIMRSFRRWKTIEKLARKAGALKTSRRSLARAPARGRGRGDITVVDTD